MKRRSSRRKAKNSNLNLLGMTSLGLLVIVTIFSISNLKQQKVVQKPVYVAEYDTVELPVPDQAVAAGTVLNDIHLVKIAYPKHQVPTGAVIDPRELRGLAAKVNLPSKVPLFKANFTTAGSLQNPVIQSIPEGMRAMTIKVDATSAVEGWAGSGSVVDVLLVEKNQTIVIAENVKIISAERSVAPVEGEVAPNVPKTVTLLVSQEQCLKINTAIPRGKIAFALRSLGDKQNWGQTIFTADKLSHDSSDQALLTFNGYVEVKGEREQSQKYSLVDGRWQKIDHKPVGFFAGS